MSEFTDALAAGLTRRRFIGMGAGLCALNLFACTSATRRKPGLLGFEPVTASSEDAVRVPKGYRVNVLVRWGDPLFPDAPDFRTDGAGSAGAQGLQFGDNNDGMSLFPITADRVLLAVNNESTNLEFLYSHTGPVFSEQDVRKAKAAVGVSIVELRRTNGLWTIDRSSGYNRRIHADSPTVLTGPAAGHPLVRTVADPGGSQVLGTLANCANGATPWGTFLTCEENFDLAFGSSGADPATDRQRLYGLDPRRHDPQWFRHDGRFDLFRHPNEAHRFGWVVEVDPFDPQSSPRKRTALGRFKHENAALVVNRDGRVVIYMGDDTHGQYLYRFVSRHCFCPGDQRMNCELLAEGTLYVAKFDAPGDLPRGTGRWLPLRHGEGPLVAPKFRDQAEILVFARQAARLVGATTMDRPEWVAIHPDGKSVYCSLTNNRHRGVKAGQPVNAANPRVNNIYGQIIRWRPWEGDHAAGRFDWDVYVMAGNPGVHAGTPYAGSEQINESNKFNSPDGLAFDRDGRLWIETDGDESNRGDFEGMGNNQLLAADPSAGEIRRFMTAPPGSEVTGFAMTHDQRTLFVGIQHPGARGAVSNWPDGGASKPRSAVVQIQREDGGVIGA